MQKKLTIKEIKVEIGWNHRYWIFPYLESCGGYPTMPKHFIDEEIEKQQDLIMMWRALIKRRRKQ